MFGCGKKNLEFFFRFSTDLDWIKEKILSKGETVQTTKDFYSGELKNHP